MILRRLPSSAVSLPLARETSLYLDAMRVLAALLVFACHYSRQSFSGGLFWQLGPFGADAVMIFFVMSGFVIAHATAKKERNAADYFINRMARIYSVAIPAIVLTLACDLVGKHLDPHYTTTLWYSAGPLWQQLSTGLTFTHEFWELGRYPGSDGAYWSLGYEVPYYLFFGAALFARGMWRIVLPTALMLAAGPGIAALLPIWLLGVALYRLGRVWRAPEAIGWILFLGSIVAWAAAQRGLQAIGYDITHIAKTDYVPDYVTAFCFAINLLGFEAIAPRFGWLLRPFARLIRWAAGRSFTIYLIHLPLVKLASVMPFWSVAAPSARIATIALVLVATAIIGACFEQRREPWRRVFAAVLRRSPRADAALQPAR